MNDEVALLTTERNVMAKTLGLLIACITDLTDQGLINEDTETDTLKDLVTSLNVATSICEMLFVNEENADQGLLEIVAALPADVPAMLEMLRADEEV